MAFSTKLNLSNAKVFQGSGDILDLSGSTRFIDISYLTTPTITDPLQIPTAAWVTGQTGAIGALNGLTRVGDNITLGGALTGPTTLNLNGQSLTFATNPIQYGGDYSSQYVARSLVDAAYVTGVTSLKLNISDFNAYSGSTDTRISNVETDVTTVSGDTITNAADIATNLSKIDTVSGDTITNAADIATNLSKIDTVSGDTITNAADIATNLSGINFISGVTDTNISNIATNLSKIDTVSGDTITNAADIATKISKINNISGETITNTAEIATNLSKIN